MLVVEHVQSSREMEKLTDLAAPVLKLLDDPKTLDVAVNSDGTIWANTVGLGFHSTGNMDAWQTELLLRGVAAIRNVKFDHDHPIMETIFPITGDRIEGITWPVVDGPVMAIRTRQKKVISIASMKESGVLRGAREDGLGNDGDSCTIANELRCAEGHLEAILLGCEHRANILIVGKTGSGKTTLANSIISEWARLTPFDRVVMIEDTPELQCSLKNHVQLVTTSRISQADLLAATMRLIPTRIVVGEVRDSAAAGALIAAWNTGHAGGIATIHANDAESALRKLEILVGGGDVARSRVADAIQLVIFIDLDSGVDAGRRVREVVVMEGINQGTGNYRLWYA